MSFGALARHRFAADKWRNAQTFRQRVSFFISERLEQLDILQRCAAKARCRPRSKAADPPAIELRVQRTEGEFVLVVRAFAAEGEVVEGADSKYTPTVPHSVLR